MLEHIGLARVLLASALVASAGSFETAMATCPEGPVPESPNVQWAYLPNFLSVCPAGDLVASGHPPRFRGLVFYGDECNSPRVGVPPESIWVEASNDSGNVVVNDQPGRIFADDSTSAEGKAYITIPSLSGCGKLKISLFVSGVAYDVMKIHVRSTDTNGDGQVNPLGESTVCDLDYDGEVNTINDQYLASSHQGYAHWHRQALFGTPVRRTSLCMTCNPRCPNSALGSSSVFWSPDGRYVSFSRFVYSGQGSNPDCGDSLFDCHTFYVASDPKDGDTFLGFSFPPPDKHDYDPSWSPLGTEMIFSRDDHTIVRKGVPGLAADTSEHILITMPGDGRATTPAISPDGKWVAFPLRDPSEPGAPQDIWIMPVSGDVNQMKRLTTGLGTFYPEWSPDGEWVYFVETLNGLPHRAQRVRPHLYSSEPAGPPEVVFELPDPNQDVTQCGVSPDSLIVVAGAGPRGALGSPSYQIGLRTFVDDFGGSQPGVTNFSQFVDRPITVNSMSPRFSPDGTRVAFRSQPPSRLAELEQLWAVRRNMSLPPQILRVGGQVIDHRTPFIDRTVSVGQLLQLRMEAWDPEGDAMIDTAFFLRKDLGMAYDRGTKTFSWRPPAVDAGKTHTVKFIVMTPSGGTDYALARITVASSGGCPFVDTQSDSGWTVENSILSRSLLATPSVDVYRLKTAAARATGRYRLRVRENEHEFTSFDQASLAAVDHAPDTRGFWLNNGVVLGNPQPAPRVTTASGQDVTRLVNGTEAGYFTGNPGDTLLIDTGQGALPTELKPSSSQRAQVADSLLLIIDAARKYIPNAALIPALRAGLSPAGTADSQVLNLTGIDVQVPNRLGGWSTVTRHYPREAFDEAAIRVPASGTLRLVFVGQHQLRYLGRLVPSGEATPQTLNLLAAQHSRVGNVLPLVLTADGITIAIIPGDTLSLDFAAPPESQGSVRELFLSANGVYSSTAPAEAGFGSVATRTWQFELGPAYPNPSSGTVNFSFTMAQQGPVSIRVYDVAGRLVRTLINGAAEPGPHDLVWNATDEGGRRVGAGVYFYKMLAGSWQSQRKVVFINR